jgi:hypothetical protein
MNPALVQIDEPPVRSRHQLAVVVAGLLVWSALFTGVFALVRDADFVDRVTIVNPTERALDVDVSGSAHRGWTGLATVEPRSTTDVEQVVDQGRHWVFRFTDAGAPVGEVRVSRDRLAHDGWRVRAPSR